VADPPSRHAWSHLSGDTRAPHGRPLQGTPSGDGARVHPGLTALTTVTTSLRRPGTSRRPARPRAATCPASAPGVRTDSYGKLCLLYRVIVTVRQQFADSFPHRITQVRQGKLSRYKSL